jgi:hypothetical protein
MVYVKSPNLILRGWNRQGLILCLSSYAQVQGTFQILKCYSYQVCVVCNKMPERVTYYLWFLFLSKLFHNWCLVLVVHLVGGCF